MVRRSASVGNGGGAGPVFVCKIIVGTYGTIVLGSSSSYPLSEKRWP